MTSTEKFFLTTICSALTKVDPRSIGVDLIVDSNWDGAPRVVIRSTTRSIERFQFGNSLTIYDVVVDLLASDREEVERLAAAVVAKISSVRPSDATIKNVDLISKNVSGIWDGGVRRRESAATLKYQVYQLSKEDAS